MIDLLVSRQFTNGEIHTPRSKKNSGGGMSILVDAIQAALSSKYTVATKTDVKDCDAEIVFSETCYWTSNISDPKYIQGVSDRLTHWKSQKHRKKQKHILIVAELTLLRMLPSLRDHLLSTVDVLAVTDPYLLQLLQGVGIYPRYYLCDCIDPNLFRPRQKKMVVTAVGGLKYIKNLDWIVEVFRLLEGKIRRTYCGGISVWSAENRLEDVLLEKKIKSVCDDFYENLSPIDVAYHNGESAFAVNNTWHDCSCRANEELLMSGVISIHGQHPLFRGRPGFTAGTPEEAVSVIEELTNGFQKLPNPKHFQASRNWALENVSTDTFLSQFDSIIKGCI